MTTSPVVTITDELIAELEAAANACCPMFLDSAETLTPADSGVIECPICSGEGYASLENDYCNFDNHAIGVQFYGIGGEFGAGERYFRAASPAVIRALLAERAELKLRAAQGDWLIEYMASEREDLDDMLMEGCSDNQPNVLRSIIDAAMQAAQ